METMSDPYRAGVSGLRRRLGAGAGLCCLWLVVGPALSIAQAEERAVDEAPAERGNEKKPPALEVVARLGFESAASPVVDLRWSGPDRLYVLRLEDGVEEVEAAAGLPHVRQILPGRHQFGTLLPHRNLARSGEFVASSAINGQLLTARVPSSGAPSEFHIQSTRSSIGDFDLEGDRIVLLGYAARGAEAGYSMAWQAKFDPQLEPLEPVSGLAPARDLKQAQTWAAYMGGEVGSVRILSNGDRLIFAGYEPHARLVSSAGKEKKSWDLSELGIGPRIAVDEAFAASSPSVDATAVLLAQPVSIDDVLAVGKTPALVVRQSASGQVKWRLALLEADRIRIFTIPVRGGLASDSRVRGDCDDHGRVAFVVGQRGKLGTRAERGQEILVATVPY